MELGIVSIQRDRGPWLAEWFAFHYLVGFRRFYFYAHLCTDNTVAVIQQLARKININCLVISDKMDRVQLAAYQHACDNFLDEVDWMAFIDGDEFLFPTQCSTMQEALAPFLALPISALAVYNVNFGSSGHLVEPAGLVTENFRHCAPPGFWANRRIKSVVRGQQKVSVSNNSHYFLTGQKTVDEQNRLISAGFMEDYVPSYEVLRINHYVCQSYEYFKGFKSSSGHADAGAANVRGEDWWLAFDQNEQFDNSLNGFAAELRRTLAWLLE